MVDRISSHNVNFGSHFTDPSSDFHNDIDQFKQTLDSMSSPPTPSDLNTLQTQYYGQFYTDYFKTPNAHHSEFLYKFADIEHQIENMQQGNDPTECIKAINDDLVFLKEKT